MEVLQVFGPNIANGWISFPAARVEARAEHGDIIAARFHNLEHHVKDVLSKNPDFKFERLSLIAYTDRSAYDEFKVKYPYRWEPPRSGLTGVWNF